MNMNCNIVGDLLPLYADGVCSPDSRKALEEHLAECPACREKLARMQSADAAPSETDKVTPPRLKTYAKKVRWRRIVLGVLCFLLVGFALLSGLALMDLYTANHPTVFDVEAGTVNLSAGSLTTAASEAERMVFYTNYECIRVAVEAEGELSGEVFLRCDGQDIRQGHVGGGRNDVTFSGLTASSRYQVRFEGLENATVTVSDGRSVSFWDSLGRVCRDLLGGQ